jgi:hypothetical protein
VKSARPLSSSPFFYLIRRLDDMNIRNGITISGQEVQKGIVQGEKKIRSWDNYGRNDKRTDY